MRPIQRASVLIPTWQAMEFLERVLDALAGQVCPFPWDVLVIDSGSTDGTLECLARRSAGFPVPLRVQSIASASFDHGDTRNLLASRTNADLLVFLTQDAIPSSASWLATLARNFDDPAVGAAYCRNVPREDCWPLTRAACEDDPGYSPHRAEVRLPAPEVYARLDVHERRVLYNFNDVASAVRRELWERHPFPRTMMGEDVLMARGVLEAGFTVVYDAEASVQHSHDYEPDKLHWRGEVDAKFNAEWLGRVLVATAEDVPILAQRLADTDIARLATLGASATECEASRARALELRTALVRGLHAGSLAPRRFPRTSMRAHGRLRVLQVRATGEAGAALVGQALLHRGHDVLDAHVRLASGALAARVGDHGAVKGLDVDVADDAAGRAALARWIESLAPDVVHVRGNDPTAALVVEAAWCAGRPVALGLGDTAPEAGVAARIGLAAATADLVLVPSVATKRRLTADPAFIRVEPHRIVCHVEGAHLDRLPLRPKTCAPHVRFGLFVARLQDLDAAGVERLVMTARELGAGAARLRVHVQARPADSGPPTAPGVEWVLGYAESDLPDLFADLDVLVALPRPTVTDPRLVATALALETPVVVPAPASAGPPGGELVVEGVNGLRYDAAAEGAFAGVLRRFCEDRVLAQHLRPRRSEAPTLVEEVAELEFRYRGMACLAREGVLPARVALAVDGHALAPTGPAEPQGAHALLLRPGASAALSLEAVPPGPFELALEQLALGCEGGLVLGLSVSLDGAPIGVAEPTTGPTTGPQPAPAPRGSLASRVLAKLGGRAPSPPPAPAPATLPAPAPDRTLRTVIRGFAPLGSRTLSLGSGPFHARVTGLTWTSHAVPQATPRPVPSNPQLRIAERLRVQGGPPVAEGALPELSVVIPTLDGLEVLVPCLASIAEARYPAGKLRVFVVDNGSSDGTVAHLRREAPHVAVVALSRNEGFARACNLGAAAAHDAHDAPIVVFLNNDMRVARDFFVELASPIVRRECAATVAKRLSWDGTKLDGAGVGSTFAGIAVQPGFGAPPGPEHDVPRRTLFPCGGAMAIDARILRDVGGFDEEFFAYYEDLDLGWRMWVLGHATHYVPTAVAFHHHSHTSKRFPPASLRRIMIRNSLLACLKNYDDENLGRVLPVILPLAMRRAWLATGLDSAQHRIEDARGLARSGATAEDEPPTPIRSLGAGDLGAIDDVLGRFEHWLERRRAVQARRVLPDREIFPMFLEPLACVEGDPAYQALQANLLALYRTRELFTGP